MGRIKLLKASAGSGKTYQLAYEYVRSVIEEPMQYKHILAVTFTNKATEEMKRRIIAEINDLAQGADSGYLGRLKEELLLTEEVIRSRAKLARTKILHDYNHFAILTIDKFFQRIIRSFIKELGIDLNFNLELQTDTLLSSASNALIDDIPTNRQLREWIAEFIEEKIEEGRKWDIKTGLSALGYELFKEQYKSVSAETSKEKLGEIVASASQKSFAVLAGITKAAQQVMEIMHANGLSVNDFSNKDKGVAGYLQKVANGEIKPYGAYVKKALESDDAWCAKSSSRASDIKAAVPSLRPLLMKICHDYDSNISFINSTELLRENYRNFALLADLAEKINDLCAEQSIMPISETNHILNKLISGNDTPFIFEKTGNHFARFMIDEFQDTSAMQWANFLPLLRNAISQTPDSQTPVLLVGDVKQSIYRWRGGDWKILARDIEKEFKDIIPVDLVTNFRSYSNIIEFNNAIVESCVDADNTYLNATLEQAKEGGFVSGKTEAQLRDMLQTAYRNHAQTPTERKQGGYVNITMYDTNEEGKSIPPVIEHIEQLQERGYAPGEIAVLVRGNREGAEIANMLLEHKSNNPDSRYCYNVVSAEALTIGASDAVGFILACLKLSAGISPSINSAIYNKWLGRDFGTPLAAEDEAFIATLKTKALQEAFEDIVSYYKLDTHAADTAYIQALHEQMVNFSNNSISDMNLFIKWWDETGHAKSVYVPNENSAITIITIHKAKGLQYKAVLIPYCNWSLKPKSRSILWAEGEGDVNNDNGFRDLGAIPVGYVKKMGDSYFSDTYYNEMVLSHIDNINIFYVAVTRAEEELHIMIPNSHKVGNSINALVTQAVASNGEVAVVGSMHGKVTTNSSGNVVYEFGTPLIATESKGSRSDTLSLSYTSYPISDRLKLRMPTQRYVEEGVDITLSPRNFGILMHQVFETSDSMDEVKQSISRMVSNGIISADEAAVLAAKTEEAFNNPLAASWFDGSYKQVRNENDIIVPGSIGTKRPDRVMLRDSEAIVVDYKFGLARRPAYARQIKEYMDLLGQMGFGSIRGYIWYVSLNDIESVE